MSRINFLAEIKDHTLRIYEKEKFEITVANAPKGQYWGTLEKIYRKRSVKQNKTWFGIAYKILQGCFIDTFGDYVSIEWVHNYCKNNLLPPEYLERIKKEWENDPKHKILNKDTGEEITFKFVPTTTQMNIVEGMEYYSNMQNFAMEWFQVEIPDPKSKEDDSD